MNISDFSRLNDGLLEGKKHPQFDKSLSCFDDIVFNKIKSNKGVPAKKFLLENLSTSGVEFLLENYALEVKDICLIGDFIFNSIERNDVKDSDVSENHLKILTQSIENAVVHLDQEDLLSLTKSQPAIKNIILTKMQELANKGELSHITSFSAQGLVSFVLSISDKEMDFYPDYIKSNVIWASSQFTPDELELLKDPKVIILFKNFINTISLKNSFNEHGFIFKIFEDDIWKKVNLCPDYAQFFFEILNVRHGFIGIANFENKNLFAKWLTKALSQYGISPCVELARMIACSQKYSFSELQSFNISIPFSEYVAIKSNLFSSLKTETIDIVKKEGEMVLATMVCEIYGSTLNAPNSKISFANAFLQGTPCQKLEIVNTVLLLPCVKMVAHDLAENLCQVFSENLISKLLDEMKENYTVSMQRFKPSVRHLYTIKEVNALNLKHFIGSLVRWQEANSDCDVIDWSELYENFYYLDSQYLHNLGSDLVRSFAVCSIKNLLTSPSGGLFALNLNSAVGVQGDDSIKWLSYSPDSTALEGFFRKNTNNNSILFTKMVLRTGWQNAQQSELLPNAVWRLAFNHRYYRNTLSVMFPFFDFSSMSMGEMKGQEDNFFACNILKAPKSFQSQLSSLPISYDMLEDVCEEASDEEIIAYIEQQPNTYMPELLLEEFYERGLYKITGYYDKFFEKADSILSFKQTDEWKKSIFKEMGLYTHTSIAKNLWDRLLEVFVLEEYANTRNDIEYFNASQEKLRAIYLDMNILKPNEKITDEALWNASQNFDFSCKVEIFKILFTKDKFKRTIALMKSPYIAMFIYLFCEFNTTNNIEALKGFAEKLHITMSESFISLLFNAMKRTKALNLPVDKASSLAKTIFCIFPNELVQKYYEEFLNAFPEAIYNDCFQCNETQEFIEHMSLEKILELTEKAVSDGCLMGSELVAPEYFIKKFQKEVYMTSTVNIELFKKYPVGYAFLNLLPPLSNQKAIEAGWSLALSNSSHNLFLAGLRVMTSKLVQFSSSHNFVLLEALSGALINGGSTIGLIRKSYLIYLRDYQPCLYLYFLDRLGNEDTLEGFIYRMKRLSLEQKLTLFEEFALSVVTCNAGLKRSIVPLEDIYRDVNVSDAHSILYYLLDNLGENFNDLEFLISRLNYFIAKYPTIYKDMRVKSSFSYCTKTQLHENFFVAISQDVLFSILNKHRLQQNMERVSGGRYSSEDEYLDKM